MWSTAGRGRVSGGRTSVGGRLTVACCCSSRWPRFQGGNLRSARVALSLGTEGDYGYRTVPQLAPATDRPELSEGRARRAAPRRRCRRGSRGRRRARFPPTRTRAGSAGRGHPGQGAVPSRATHRTGHDQCVGDSQAAHTAQTQIEVDDRVGAGAHRAGADRVEVRAGRYR